MNKSNDIDGYYDKPKWFDQIGPDPNKFPAVNDQTLIELKEEAKKILDAEAANYNIKNTKTNSDFRWMKTVITKGTVADKTAAFTVMIQDNPVYNLETVRNMIGIVKVSKKKECIAVIQNLSELFLQDLLRPVAKLKSFSDRPLSLLSDLSSGNAITRRKYLSHWYFEDQLKEAYNTFIQALNTVAHDTVDANKEKAIAAMANLLAGNPEQEKNLLGHLINKMGDPSQKVASKTMYCLTQLLKKHTNMQGVVLKEIEKLLFRQNIGRKAQYYSLCFISQFYLCAENPEVAMKLIELYFSFFKKCVKEGDVDSRLMSVLMIGVNRAYPYAKLELDKISEHINTIYRIVHVANFGVALNALHLLFQVSAYSDNVSDRYYSALYRKLFTHNLDSSKHYAQLLNLVYKSLMRDDKTPRITAFIKRLLQIALNVQPCFACGILFLISELQSKKSGLHLLSFPVYDSDKKKQEEDEEDDEEKYTDVKDAEDEETEKEVSHIEEKVTPSWVHRVNTKPADSSTTKAESSSKDRYNPMVRNPLYAKTHLTSYTELLLLQNHYHPSVCLFAQHLLNREKINYTGDPLKDFSQTAFLERFVFKNPKRAKPSFDAMPLFAKRKQYVPQGVRSLPVMSNDYIMQKESNIPVDELYLYNYMRQKYKDAPIKKSRGDEDDSDNESVASEEFEDMLDKMSGFRDKDGAIDFMQGVEEFKRNKQTKKKGAEADQDEQDSDDDDDDEDDNDEDEDFGDDSDDGNHISDDEDLDDLEMNDEDRELLADLSGDEEETSIFIDDTEEKLKGKKKKKGKQTNGSLFAAAEEFASLLEDEGMSKVKPGSSNQYANTDKAAAKQLDWEDKRNRWIKGYNSAVGGGGGRRKRGAKRPPPSQQRNKNKKVKK